MQQPDYLTPAELAVEQLGQVYEIVQRTSPEIDSGREYWSSFSDRVSGVLSNVISEGAVLAATIDALSVVQVPNDKPPERVDVRHADLQTALDLLEHATTQLVAAIDPERQTGSRLAHKSIARQIALNPLLTEVAERFATSVRMASRQLRDGIQEHDRLEDGLVSFDSLDADLASTVQNRIDDRITALLTSLDAALPDFVVRQSRLAEVNKFLVRNLYRDPHPDELLCVVAGNVTAATNVAAAGDLNIGTLGASVPTLSSAPSRSLAGRFPSQRALHVVGAWPKESRANGVAFLLRSAMAAALLSEPVLDPPKLSEFREKARDAHRVVMATERGEVSDALNFAATLLARDARTLRWRL